METEPTSFTVSYLKTFLNHLTHIC